MKILGIGESVMDNVYQLEGGSTPDDLIDMPHSKHIGGSTLAAMVLMSRLGAKCTFVTAIGKDENGLKILNFLEKEGISVIPHFSIRTKVNNMIINNLNGSRRKIRGEINLNDLSGIGKEFLEQFDGIIMDRHEKTAFYEVLKNKKISTKIFIDTSTEVSEFTIDMIKNADYPIIPIEYLLNIGTLGIEKNLKNLYALTKKTIIVTAGSDGCLLYDGLNIQTVKAVRIKPIDVTGAGDVFRGGFAYGILRGMSIRNAAEFANILASIQCKKIGNISAIPSSEDLEVIMQSIEKEGAEVIQI